MARKQKQWEVADKNIEGQYTQIHYIQKHRWTMETGNSRRIQIRIYSRHFLRGWLVELVSFYIICMQAGQKSLVVLSELVLDI